MEAHAHPGRACDRPAAHVARVLRVQHHVARGQVQPIEIERAAGAPGVADDLRVQHHVARGQVQPIEIDARPVRPVWRTMTMLGSPLTTRMNFYSHPVEAASGRAR